MSTNDGKYILAIDLGTSGPKVALVSPRGEVVAHEFEETPVLLLPGGGAEQKPDDWWRAIREATRRLLARALVAVDDIVALCCTTQWSGTVAVDKDGRPLMNAIIWMDARGAPYVRHITGGRIKVAGYGAGKLLTWLRLTGGIPTHSGKDSIAHILYIKHEFPQIYEQTHKFLEPKDYLNLRLTGRFAASYDSITLHWVTDNRDIANVNYHDKLLAMSTIDGDKLPPLKQAVDILGPIKPAVAAELGLNEQVKVVMGTPDLHSAAIGSGAVQDYEPHLYIGTSSWLTCHVPFKKTDLFHNMASLPSAVPDRYLVVNEQETAGACLNFLKNNVLFHEEQLVGEARVANIYQLFDQMVERAPDGSGGAIFTPWLNGERTPVDDHVIRGGFHNLSLWHTRDHLVRAVFEGVAFNSRWLLGYVEKFVKRQFDTINMVGGGANSNIWCQIHADVLNRTIRQVQDPILANVRGAAVLAAVALGYTSFDDVSHEIQIANAYRPRAKNRRTYDQLFQEFVNIYKQNRKIHARLNGKGAPDFDSETSL